MYNAILYIFSVRGIIRRGLTVEGLKQFIVRKLIAQAQNLLNSFKIHNRLLKEVKLM